MWRADVPLEWWVSVCSVNTEDGGWGVGGVYRVTHLCTVPCQIQDTDVHILSKTVSKREEYDANQMLCPRISKQSSFVYFQNFYMTYPKCALTTHQFCLYNNQAEKQPRNIRSLFTI